MFLLAALGVYPEQNLAKSKTAAQLTDRSIAIM